MSKPISCYLLCGSLVRRVDGYPSASGNIYVDCPECGEYIIAEFVQRYHSFPNGPNETLNDDDKKKLSDYVREKYKRGKTGPVIIDMKVVKLVTGKESVHYR